MDRKILILGKGGQVATDLSRSLVGLGNIRCLGRADLDLVDLPRVEKVIREEAPTLIINAAAMTAVERAEKEPALARQVNSLAPELIARVAKDLGAWMLHYSTDYVFDGKKKAPYEEADPVCPLNVYGESKAEGEKRIQAVGGMHLIVRTSGVYSSAGRNFFRAILHRAKEPGEVRVVNDQKVSPTSSRSIADGTSKLVKRLLDSRVAQKLSGIYHLTATDATTWFEFAQKIYELDPKKAEHKHSGLVPVSSEAYGSPVKRPLYSVLSNEKCANTFGLRLPDWQAQLKIIIKDIAAH